MKLSTFIPLKIRRRGVSKVIIRSDVLANDETVAPGNGNSGGSQYDNRSGWLTTNCQSQTRVNPGFSAATTRGTNREKLLGWCGKHRLRRFLPKRHPQHGRPEPRVVWGLQARKRARRLSEPFNLVGWGLLKDAL
jgi:hypothetical protein